MACEFGLAVLHCELRFMHRLLCRRCRRLMQWLQVSFAKNLAAVDDRRKIILLQRVENVPKTFLEKGASPLVIAMFKSALSWRHSSIKILRTSLPSVGNITNLKIQAHLAADACQRCLSYFPKTWSFSNVRKR